MSLLSTARMFFLLTILRDVAPNDIGYFGTESEEQPRASSAIDIQYGSKSGTYDGLPRESVDVRYRKPFLMDIYIGLSSTHRVTHTDTEPSSTTSFTVGAKDLEALIRRASPSLVVQPDLIQRFQKPQLRSVSRSPWSLEKGSIINLMIQDGAEYFVVIPGASVGDPNITISDAQTSYQQDKCHIMKLDWAPIDFNTMMYYWFPDPTDNHKHKLFLIDGFGRIETLVKSNRNLRQAEAQSSNWELLSDGFEVPENQLQFILDLNDVKENKPISKSTTKFWAYSSDLYAAVMEGSLVHVFNFDWNMKVWTHHAEHPSTM